MTDAQRERFEAWWHSERLKTWMVYPDATPENMPELWGISVNRSWEAWQACEAQQQARIDELERFARDVATNYDCDSDAHKYGTTCRACKAQIILAAGGEVK